MTYSYLKLTDLFLSQIICQRRHQYTTVFILTEYTNILYKGESNADASGCFLRVCSV